MQCVFTVGSCAEMEPSMEWRVRSRKEIVFFVNCIKVTEKRPDPSMTLLYYLRNKLGLIGTKLGCGEGGCGACTVMVSSYQQQSKTIRHYSVNACIVPLCSVDGLAVTTVEGIGSVARGLHPVQERLAKAHGSQCGFCTPGIVMSMYTLLRNSPKPSQSDIERAFDGNLCRCTGYRPILDGYKTFAKGDCCCGAEGGKCCKGNETCVVEKTSPLFDPSKFKPLDPTQEPIFPPELQLSAPVAPLFIQGPLSSWEHDGKKKTHQTTWIQPVTLEQLLEAKEKYKDAKIIVGSSEITVEMKVRGFEYLVFISPVYVPEMTALQVTQEGLLVGASCSLTDIRDKMQELVGKLPGYKTQTFQAMCEMLRWFAGDQIRNVASLGGNLMTASPISDLNPILMAVGATVTISSRKGGQRKEVVNEKFFKSYRKVAMEADEVLISILLPFNEKSEHVMAFKQARRREDDIAIVNACFKVVLAESEHDRKQIVQTCRLVYGGCAAVTKSAIKTEQELVGLEWDAKLLERALELLPGDLPLQSNAPGGMPEYRIALMMSLFYKFYTAVTSRICEDSVSPAEMNITTPFKYIATKSSQGIQDVPFGQSCDDTVGRPISHLSANKQVSGEALYVDDMPKLKNELYAGLVVSTRAHAKILNIDASEALCMPGVWGFVSAKDIGKEETNLFRVVTATDEVVFAEDEVTCRGQLIGLLLADNEMLAKQAAKQVHISYKELPSVLTIQEAIEANSFYEQVCSNTRGNVESALAVADHIVTGEVEIGGQEHFYLETQACSVVPKEDGEMEIFASTQNAHDTQMTAALVTGVPSNRIIVRVKRIGGAFGGKQTRSIPLSSAVALAAKKCGRPVRVMLDRNVDMLSTGTRHPYFARYKVGCTKDGKITAAKVELYSNSGNTLDLSAPVLEKAVNHIDNTYNISNWEVIGKNCKTNIASNTAFRTFGAPQSMLVAETFLCRVAEVCEMDPTVVRHLNLYHDGDITVFGQKMVDCHLEQCWTELLKVAQIDSRRAAVDAFNKNSRWLKRGLAVVPTKFGISYGKDDSFLNQGGALVHIYNDGAVLVSHGGVEMGQGLHTKMAQVAARVLQVPVSKVYISEMATNCVPNASPTAASVSADVYGEAVKDACEQLMTRLHPFMEANRNGKWEEWVMAAYLDRVSLSASGFSDFGFPPKEKSAEHSDVYKYFTFGVACSEVEVDTLTGSHHTIRTDIVMDVGESINPAIDIGQIEGAFAQGLGLFTLEEHVLLDGDETVRGHMITNGPGAYKLPGFSDIPREMNVYLLKDVPNKRAIYSSKAIGEPPLFLAASVFFAIKDAITASRRDCGVTTSFTLNSPATAERIRMACADRIVENAKRRVIDNGKRWNIGI